MSSLQCHFHFTSTSIYTLQGALLHLLREVPVLVSLNGDPRIQFLEFSDISYCSIGFHMTNRLTAKQEIMIESFSNVRR